MLACVVGCHVAQAVPERHRTLEASTATGAYKHVLHHRAQRPEATWLEHRVRDLLCVLLQTHDGSSRTTSGSKRGHPYGRQNDEMRAAPITMPSR